MICLRVNNQLNIIRVERKKSKWVRLSKEVTLYQYKKQFLKKNLHLFKFLLFMLVKLKNLKLTFFYKVLEF